MNILKNQSISILGSTGSIGTQALDVVEKLGLRVVALSANRNEKLLEQQIRKFRPKIAVLGDQISAGRLRENLRDMEIEILSGEEGVCEAASDSRADLVLNAIVGIAGLRPTIAVLEAKKTLALANKESLVTGGRIVIETARRNGVKILPVDSEHSAIFQCLQGSCDAGREVKKILLTASGGPFYGFNRSRLEKVTPAQALKHPNWSMGAKITIDSATLMNKGLELMEAAWLFGVQPGRIEILVHRESIVHSAVEFVD
ncbi:MAG TPA: 1-deoxy-D-xylulose-5-phosphate reductoisomerase, partial [Clostridia bacterium]|nr:1-deoxy-D-xylulose-5-phosphate reductoisomerase [Clostridia bacterium]